MSTTASSARSTIKSVLTSGNQGQGTNTGTRTRKAIQLGKNGKKLLTKAWFKTGNAAAAVWRCHRAQFYVNEEFGFRFPKRSVSGPRSCRKADPARLWHDAELELDPAHYRYGPFRRASASGPLSITICRDQI